MMDGILKLYDLIKTNGLEIMSAVAHLTLFASVIVKLTPTLKDDAWLLPFIKFVGKYIALDKYKPPAK